MNLNVVSCFFSRSTDSPNVQRRLCVGFLQFLYFFLLLKSTKEIFRLNNKRHLKAKRQKFRWKRSKKSVMCTMNECETTNRRYTNVQKSHFYLPFAPLPPCLLCSALSLDRSLTKLQVKRCCKPDRNVKYICKA